MIGKLVLIGLALVLFLAMIGKLRLPKAPEPPAVEKARKCPGCGAYVVGDAACTTPGCRGE
jgi:hypothetical protein